MAELNLLPQDKRNYTGEVIKAVSVGAIVTSAIIAPNLLQLLAKTLSDGKSDKTLRAIRYAKTQGWLTFEETDSGVKVALTESGRLKWQAVQLNTTLAAKIWDKKWRFILFDIPVGLKSNADTFRRHLKRLGIKQLQQSVWATPYPCQTEVALLRQMYAIKPFVRIIEANTVENEAALKQTFKLP